MVELTRAALYYPRGVGRQLVAHNSLVALPYCPAEADLSVIDPKIEATVRIGTDPCLVGNRRAFSAIIRKWNQGSLGALLTARPFLNLHLSSGAELRAA